MVHRQVASPGDGKYANPGGVRAFDLVDVIGLRR